MQLNTLLLNNYKTKKVLGLINNRHNVAIDGLNNSRLTFFISNILPHIQKNILFLTSDNLKVEQYYEDFIRLIPQDKVMIYPEKEALPHEQIVADLPETRERLRVLQKLLFGDNQPRLILTSVTTLVHRLLPVDIFKDLSFSLKCEEEWELTDLIDRLAKLGYERVEMVEEPAHFSVRGGILDIYTITNEFPYRIEFFGDEIDSIREFDPSSQRSEHIVEEIVIPPVRELLFLKEDIPKVIPRIRNHFNQAIKSLEELRSSEEAEYLQDKKESTLEKLEEFHYIPGYEQFLPYFYQQINSLLDYFVDDTLIVFEQVDKLSQRLKSKTQELAETQATLLEQGSVIPSYLDNFIMAEKVISDLKNRQGLFCVSHFKENPFTKTYEDITFSTKGIEPYHGKMELLVERLKELINNNYQIIITLNSSSKARRIAEFLQENGLPSYFTQNEFEDERLVVTVGSLSEGFIIEDIKLVIFTEKEVMGKSQRKKRQLRDLEEGVKINSFNELVVGDYVVHENHGIGKYLGVKTMEIQGQHQDYLVLKYSGEDKLYVPTDQVNLVQKFIGADQNPPKLYKLGGSDWKKIKQKVKNSVKEMAIGLLELYAERETVEGYSFSEDTVWQQEFEEAFPYEETPDQFKAIEDVKNDMEASTPMDRLLCGDVGYGKTEVAIRAAFKAAMDGKQTAILVPTTILAQQHYNTFAERMENYPIQIAMISRFKTAREQRDILKKLALGEVDIIIGTHRLLSKDVVFPDLGLLVVDEEQRFGVTHKERLKDIKRNVDVLTLTATPIPRTLHMALVGVRDMSVIETPPENRYPIRTYIREFNRELVRDAIRKEVSRAGQIYFVHNRVEDIEEKADMIRKVVPDCKVAVAHGQMNEHRLERLMLKFYNREFDVLVCTTIIETGLDLPNVNTIIIDRADQMGLAQLYQLRGRVGRSNRIAYAYLLYERDRILPEVAEKRLRAIKEFTNLGSGFKIAMRDLEIRGAGNLLGPEQHGHIASIGFSLYCKLLENAVEELKGKADDNDNNVEINLDVDAYLPDNYIADSRQKIEIYKKIMTLRDEKYFTDVIDELIDRFGEPPQPVTNLVKIARLKTKAIRLGINKIKRGKQVINCYFAEPEKFNGKAIFKLIDKFPGKLNIKNGNQPILGIKGQIVLLEKILDSLLEIEDKVEV